jgi:hypothetical protein
VQQYDVAIMLCEGGFPLYHSINDFHETGLSGQGDGAKYKSENFDLMTFRDYNITTYSDDDGQEHTLECNERYYVPSEITWLLKSLGYTKIDIFGARLGEFSRNHTLTTRDFEMLVIADLSIP